VSSMQPPESDEPDDIDALYQRWSAADGARPSHAAAQAILANAAAVALEAKQRAARHRSPRQRWTLVVAGLAAATFAGLLVTPLFLRVRPPARSPAASLDAAVRPSAAPAAKDSTLALARSYAQPNPAAAPVVVPPPASPTLSSNSDSQRTAERSSDLSMTARARAAPSALAEVEPAFREASLRHAARVGDEAGVSTLLREPIDINSRDSDGRSALMLAVIGGRANIVALLIEHGADPNATDAQGETPLRAALTARRSLIAAELRRAGAR
jgi:hypothetical protein